jgi:hypothetical protein
MAAAGNLNEPTPPQLYYNEAVYACLSGVHHMLDQLEESWTRANRPDMAQASADLGDNVMERMNDILAETMNDYNVDIGDEYRHPGFFPRIDPHLAYAMSMIRCLPGIGNTLEAMAQAAEEEGDVNSAQQARFYRDTAFREAEDLHNEHPELHAAFGAPDEGYSEF